MALTDMTVRQAKATGKDRYLVDFDGLSLYISAQGSKCWHFRYSRFGKRFRISLGTYPEISLLEARNLRDNARSLLAKGIDPQQQRLKERDEARRNNEHTFAAVYEEWYAHRMLVLKECRNSTLVQIRQSFDKDILPFLGKRPIYEITRTDLLHVVARIEQRKALSVAEKVRTWLNQLFRYAMVIVPGLERNPASDLDVVALPQPPVRHNPFLRLNELPTLLQLLRKYRGRHISQLAVRLLLLTGVRTGELRHATPDQFHMKEGLWIIPADVVKQLKTKMMRENKSNSDIPPYIVPLSIQALEIIRFMLDQVRPVQRYLFPGVSDLKKSMSENTVNKVLILMGYKDRLTGHGIRATLSTALNEIGYPSNWVDAQLSHADPNAVSAAYNHAEYIEPRRHMMQDWADRLDLLEQGQIQAARAKLTVSLGGISCTPGNPSTMIVLPPEVQNDSLTLPVPQVQRLSALRAPLPENPPPISGARQEQLCRLGILAAPHNLPVAEYAKLAGKSRRWISYEIRAGNLLTISMGNHYQRVPDWQLNPIKRTLIQTVLKTSNPADAWQVYHALTQPQAVLGGLPPIEAVTHDNLSVASQLVINLMHNQGSSD